MLPGILAQTKPVILDISSANWVIGDFLVQFRYGEGHVPQTDPTQVLMFEKNQFTNLCLKF